MSWAVVCGKCGSDKVDGKKVPGGVLWACPDCGSSVFKEPICPDCGLTKKQHEDWCPRSQGEEE